MAKSLLDLADIIEKRLDRIKEAASEVVADVALSMVLYLASVTPVDTSRALSNWIVTLDSPSSWGIFPHYPGLKGSTQSESIDETYAKAENVLENKKPGQVIFITNNVNYIRDLNQGSSRQHPGGFVEAAVMKGRKAIKWPKKI